MNAHYRQEVGIDFEKVGNTLENLGDINGALESYRNELRIFEEQSVTDPANAQFRSDLSSAYLKVESMLARIGKSVDALLHQNKALAIREESATADPLDCSVPPKRCYLGRHAEEWHLEQSGLPEVRSSNPRNHRVSRRL